MLQQKVTTKDALCALEVCKFDVIKNDTENENPFSKRNIIKIIKSQPIPKEVLEKLKKTNIDLTTLESAMLEK